MYLIIGDTNVLDILNFNLYRVILCGWEYVYSDHCFHLCVHDLYKKDIWIIYITISLEQEHFLSRSVHLLVGVWYMYMMKSSILNKEIMV